MPELDDRLRTELHERAGVAQPSADLARVMGAAVGRRRRRGQALAATAMVALLAMVGGALLIRAGDEDSTRVVTGPNPPTGNPGEWTPMPDGPLSPRSDALAFTVGDEILIFGGGPACPPSAFCVPRSWNGHVDGAAYEPAALTWRPIADMPHTLDDASGTVIGDRVYLWGQYYCEGANCDGESVHTFTSYDAGKDEWTQLPLPDGFDADGSSGEQPTITALSGKIALAQVDADGTSTDRLFDPDTNDWTDLPIDPLRPGHDRMMAADGEGGLYLFATPAAGSPFDVAVLRAGATAWERLASSQVDPQRFDFRYRWYPVDGTFIWPSPSQAPPSDDDFPDPPPGEQFDTRTGTFAELPASQTSPGFETVPVAGTRHIAAGGLVFDVAAGVWSQLPEPDDWSRDGAAAWIGDALVVWGGTNPDAEGFDVYDTDTGAVWTAPPPSGDS